MPRVEWIGVRSPMTDEAVTYQLMTGQYSDAQEALLRADTDALSPLVRADGVTARAMGRNDGLSREHTWGPRRGTYVQDVTAGDAALLRESVDAAEFRNLDDPAERERQPAVPLHRIKPATMAALEQAAKAPKLRLRTLLEQRVRGAA